MSRKFILAAAIAALFAAPAFAKPFEIDEGKSAITFVFTHAGKAVTGTFDDWKAEVDFDAANLPASKISATIEVDSAKTGDKLYDKALPGADWFNVSKTPEATFVSDKIEKTGEGAYVAHGILTLRGAASKLDLPFTLTPGDGAGALVKAHAATTLDRMLLGMGTQSDPKAEWVAKEVKVTIDLVANAK